MAPHVVTLRVVAPVAINCKFWAENDGWIGTADQLDIRTRGCSFEDAKRNMEATLADRISSLLDGLGRGSGRSSCQQADKGRPWL
jgi:hypothetical protein